MSDLETTQDLVALAQNGDTAARDRLLGRYLPILSRWLRGRLPNSARDLNETADLVQVTLLRAFQHLPSFEAQGPGAFFGYLRHVATNLLRDEMRRAVRRPPHEEVDPELRESAAGPLAITIDQETLVAYERALRALEPEQREVLIMRIELGMAHEEIAQVAGCASANAARMRVSRALSRVAELMQCHREPE